MSKTAPKDPRYYDVILSPAITEKATAASEHNQVVFRVPLKASKPQIKQAVEALFKVKVHAVRTANMVGKERRRGKFAGYRPDWKKAFVRLKSGEKMPEYAQNL